MADANPPPSAQPSGWADAFTSMPLDAAPGDGWARLSVALTDARAGAGAVPYRRPGGRRPARGIAVAIAASLVLALPMAWWMVASGPASSPSPLPSTASQDAGSTVRGAANTDGLLDPRAPEQRSTVAAAVDDGVAAAGLRDGMRSAAAMPRPAVSARAQESTGQPSLSAPTAVRRADAAALADRARPDATRPSGLSRHALAPGEDLPLLGQADTSALVAAQPPLPSTDAPSTDLATLRRESARLEALVAYARDGRVASAPVAVISAALDDRLRMIDSALMQPGLDELQRASLWSERVGALQELASLEGTQRWMAAHGASMNAVARVD